VVQRDNFAEHVRIKAGKFVRVGTRRSVQSRTVNTQVVLRDVFAEHVRTRLERIS